MRNCVSNIDQVFKEIRTKGNLTQKDLSDILSISVGQISRIENKLSKPKETVLRKLIDKKLATKEDVFGYEFSEKTIKMVKILESLPPKYQKSFHSLFNYLEMYLKDDRNDWKFKVKAQIGEVTYTFGGLIEDDKEIHIETSLDA